MFSGSIAAILPELDACIVFCSIAAMLPGRVIAAILPETNLHAKSSIAAVLPEYVAAILRQYCCNILPEALYFGKGNYPLFCKHALRSSLECETGPTVEPFREKNNNVKPASHKMYCLLIFSF